MVASDEQSHLPIWLDDTHIDPKWMQRVTGLTEITDCQVQDISNETRKGKDIRSGGTLRVELSCQTLKEANQSIPSSLILKQIATDSGRSLSRNLGLAREALFYQKLAPRLQSSDASLPKIYYSYGNMEDGSKLIVMEDLAALSSNTSVYVDSGILFGPGNPNNWKRNLPQLLQDAYGAATPPGSLEVARCTFLAMAKIHARFWKDTDLLTESEWLRGGQWIQGQNQKSWEASQGYIQGIWKSLVQDDSKVNSIIRWNPLVRSLVEQAVAGISWEAQLERLNAANTSCHWTLVHGDFWPGNVLISTKDTKDLKLLDWEMVGLGSAAQDLGQYVLSHLEPSERRRGELELIQAYYQELVRNGVQGYSWEKCWREYKIGGVERWLWFLVYFCGQTGDLLQWAQFFHDQILAFAQDHSIGPEDIVQARP